MRRMCWRKGYQAEGTAPPFATQRVFSCRPVKTENQDLCVWLWWWNKEAPRMTIQRAPRPLWLLGAERPCLESKLPLPRLLELSVRELSVSLSADLTTLWLPATTPPALRFHWSTVACKVETWRLLTAFNKSIQKLVGSQASKGPEAQSRCYPAAARWQRRDKWHVSVQVATLAGKRRSPNSEWH